MNVNHDGVYMSSAYAQAEDEGVLDLGSVEISKDAIVDANEPWWHLASTMFLILLLFVLVFFCPRIVRFCRLCR